MHSGAPVERLRPPQRREDLHVARTLALAIGAVAQGAVLAIAGSGAGTGAAGGVGLPGSAAAGEAGTCALAMEAPLRISARASSAPPAAA
ncbi:hypothetical protein GCM10027019_22330 [Melaminivora jejuensis]